MIVAKQFRHPVSFTCPSCTTTVYDTPEEGETLFQSKARLRVELGAQCSRSADTAKACPMRERAAKALQSA